MTPLTPNEPSGSPHVRLTLYFFGMWCIRRDRFNAALPRTTTLLLPFTLLAAAFGQEPAQTPGQAPARAESEDHPQQAETPTMLIQRARALVIDSMRRAPRYTCTETIERENWISRRETHSCETRAEADRLSSEDRLRLDVAVSEDSEIFSWHGEKQFAEGEIGDLVGYGMIGSGLFSSFLAGIFGNSGYLTRFSYSNTSTIDGQELAEYKFVMSAAASRWLMRTGNVHVIAPYHGSVWVDAKTAALKHIHIVADDLPPALQTCTVEVDLRYHTIMLGAKEFVIPERGETVSTGPSGLRSMSETKFLECHEFLGESTLHFDDLDASSAPKASAIPAQTRELPPGLRFSVDLETPIDTKESWVGDPIVGRLGENLKLSNEMIAPKGARVVGRLVALRAHLSPGEMLEIGFDWQQIEVAPATLLRLRAEFSDTSMDVTALSQGRGRGGPRTMGSAAQSPRSVSERPFVFLLSGAHKKVPRNLITHWITVGLKKEPAKPEPSDGPP